MARNDERAEAKRRQVGTEGASRPEPRTVKLCAVIFKTDGSHPLPRAATIRFLFGVLQTEIVSFYQRSSTVRDRTLNYALQFPHISWPLIVT